jgi:paraquat-inducible protein B
VTDIRTRSEMLVAKARQSFWPGAVWAIPLAALIIVSYLALQAIANQGFDVVVTFPTAAGARPGDTKVTYKGLEVGAVTKVSLNKDARHVDFKLHLDNRLRSVVKSGSVFWLEGANPSLSDLNSLKAAVSGLSIGLVPGPGKSVHRFTGLEKAPLIAPNTPGRSFWLDIGLVTNAKRGATILYHGEVAGKIMDVQSTGPQSSRAHIFVLAPYDQYMRSSSYFWSATPVQISLGGGGITGQFSPETTLNGAVSFDTPLEDMAQPPSPAGSHYDLYASQANAQQGPDGEPVFYTTTFDGAAGDLQIGAPVLLKGARIGFVQAVGLVFDPDTGLVTNPVTFAIYPRRLHMPHVDQAVAPDWRAVADIAMAALVKHGYRSSIGQNPPLIGASTFTLVKTAAAGPINLDRSGPYPSIPSVKGGDGASISDKASALLDKLNGIPINEIAENVRQTTARLKALVDSPKIDDSIDHLDRTLQSVDDITAEVKPKIGPLIDKLNQTADQLQSTASAANSVMSGTGGAQDANLPAAIGQVTDAARAVRGLADYLERHPEAIIKGKAKEGAK